jgi:hypothetical protein
MTLTKQQKQLALLGVLVIAILAVVIPFMMGGDEGTESTDPLPVVDGIVPGVDGAASGQYDFLPDGFDVDLSVLDDPRFKALNAPSYPTVSPGEYGGKADPFVK